MKNHASILFENRWPLQQNFSRNFHSDEQACLIMNSIVFFDNIHFFKLIKDKGKPV